MKMPDSLRATLTSPYTMDMPKSVVLPECAVQHSSNTTFLLRNASKLQTSFQWECTPPFQLSQKEGMLNPNQKCLVTVSFHPENALWYKQEARCRFGKGREEAETSCTVLLKGLAKYPFLTLRSLDKNEEALENPVLDFGSLTIGCSVQKPFEIYNPSPVTASFSLSQPSGGAHPLGSVFTCNVTSGEVAPRESLGMNITFTPIDADTVSVDYLTLTCPGALSSPTLIVRGKCTGPEVTLSSSLLDFGFVEKGKEVTKYAKLVNSCSAEVFYQWELDSSSHSVFSIQPTGGILGPHRSVKITVTFKPTFLIAHHRKVACDILYSDPVLLDLVGTCRSESQQPARLQPRHLSLHQIHKQRGLTQFPPHILHTMLQEGTIQRDQEGALFRVEQEEAQETKEDLEQAQISCDETDDIYYAVPSPPVTMEPAELVFDNRMSLCVTITNHTKGDISLMWTTIEDSLFAVSPPSHELSPMMSTVFNVTYNPAKQLGMVHGAQLECFVTYNIPEDYGQVDDSLVCPPWCLIVRVIGHSFQPKTEHFIPCCTLQRPIVVFPSFPAHRTVLLQNTGDRPLIFSLDLGLDRDALSTALVNMMPGCGLVLPGKHQILTLSNTPTEESTKHELVLTLQLNAYINKQVKVVVTEKEELRVSLEGEGKYYLQPTAVGCQSKCHHSIRNLCRLPLRFCWRIPKTDRKLLSAEPESGELQPNESTVQTWTFRPREVKTYTSKPELTFWSVYTPEHPKCSIPCRVTGTGFKSLIQAETKVVELGKLLVGDQHSGKVHLLNGGLCAVIFCLTVQQTLIGMGPVPATEPHVLHLDSVVGTITSRTRMQLPFTVTPQRAAQYQWTIRYQALRANGSALSPSRVLCQIRAEGASPSLQVTGVCGAGSERGFSKLQLWERFSLDSLNAQLLSIPAPSRLSHSTPSHSCLSISNAPVFEFNFNAAPLGSEPSTVHLMFENTGPFALDWSFILPEDQQLEQEYWAQTGEFSTNELRKIKSLWMLNLYFQKNHSFSVFPHSGNLLPGQLMAVQFSYRHDSLATDRCPALFVLGYGREIMLHLQGVTLEKDRPHLYCASSQHVFTPIAIECFNPPRQVFKLYNDGGVPVHYEVDIAPLMKLQEDNFNQAVVSCLTPRGELLPGQAAVTEWVFWPLDPKLYTVDVPIRIEGGDTMLVRFEGHGLDDSSPDFPEAHLSVPCVQKVPFPDQVLSLSADIISLGDIPVHSRTTRILFLNNISETETVLYKWDLSQQQVVQMKPEQGRLCPGESALCLLTFTSTGHPRVYQLHFTCQVTLEKELTQYKDALHQWEVERERQQHEFIINEKDLQGSPDNEPVGPVKHGLLLSKYKVLPPIQASGGSDGAGCPRVQRRAQVEAAKAPREPAAPRPALLHLDVMAHSHALMEYPGHIDRHHMLRRTLNDPSFQQSPESLPLFSALRDTHPSPLSSPSTLDERSDMCEEVLVNTLQNLMSEIFHGEVLLTE